MTAVALVSYGQASADVYYVCFALEYLVVSFLVGLVPRKERRALEGLGMLFGLGVVVIVLIRVAQVVIGAET